LGVTPAAAGPADLFIDPINLQTGYANDIVFQWTAIANTPSTGVTYNLQVSLDNAFTQKVLDQAGISGVLAIVGATGTYKVSYQADTTYYWRVRADAPVDSGWSTPVRSFKIGTLAPVSLIAPANGANGVSVQPTFAWTPAPGATTYEIIVSDEPAFATINFSHTTDKAVFYTADETLAYGTVYYWKVRASAPATAVTPYAIGLFTTEARPTETQPPITITSNPPSTFTVETTTTESIPAYLLWIIIGIGAILVIALIVLIVRTRRVSYEARQSGCTSCP
jgi:hypothetical protein